MRPLAITTRCFESGWLWIWSQPSLGIRVQPKRRRYWFMQSGAPRQSSGASVSARSLHRNCSAEMVSAAARRPWSLC